jgi:hypothetical protein
MGQLEVWEQVGYQIYGRMEKGEYPKTHINAFRRKEQRL